MSDYADWFRNDETGEFRDEMLVWIGCTPEQDEEAYRSRSGLTTVRNMLTPAYIVHGETDIRLFLNIILFPTEMRIQFFRFPDGRVIQVFLIILTGPGRGANNCAEDFLFKKSL